MIIVAEIGINHNGNLDIAKQMISVAKEAGCDFVKFQMRTVEVVYSKEELDKPRQSPWGTTNREQKNGLEFSVEEYDSIHKLCKDIGIGWFASPWDGISVDVLMRWNPSFVKVASALLTDEDLLRRLVFYKVPVILSTGMSTKPEIKKAVEILGPQLKYLLVCTSTYPTKPEEMNLKFINTLKKKFQYCKIGFSNHSPGLTFCIAAAAMGAEMIEFHMTLDRSMYGSDQSASIETSGVYSLCKHLRSVEKGLGSGDWIVYNSEKEIKKKLRCQK